METPAQREARCLIEKIHREHTLDGKILGTRFELLVSNCLEILSSQLYEKSTHFLLELIQNADDNAYGCPRPTLSFSYKPGGLRIDCNEVGFNSENVEAICAISRSTKSGKTSDGEYIGEKGIGFKSVFKAADVVWISSRDFTFKFDKTKFLGMVAPVWEAFPEETQPGCTSIYLQLSKCYEEDTLIHELLTFDTNLLIFLRRVEEINIRVTRRDKQVWEKKIRKDESQQGEDRLTVLHAGEETSRYLIRTHVIKDLPKEQKRPNWPQTRILLAFPTTESQEQPRLTPQNVYAFLPIRNYGLKFLLQGDFLLTASREDIESTLPWNRRIRDALAEAFLLSIDHFNQGQLKYVWPYYLPSASTAACSFLEPAVTSILRKLRECDVLESCAGTMVKPSSLTHVPLELFADGDGVPFTLSPHTAAGYLSLKYPAWAIEATSSIGVLQLSPREFLADLHSTITRDPIYFRTRPAIWHSQLARTLIKLSTDAELMSLIKDICLIPLHDGNWSSAKGQSLFFSKSETSLEIPSGIEVLIVDSTAESDPNRRTLFTSLGVKAWEAPEICRLVLKVHESSDFDSKTLTVDQLISHAAFLYKASWQPPKTADLWFATMQDERCKGRKLYIPGSIEANSPVARIFAQLQKQFAVIHNGYLRAFPLDADWPMWLVNNLGLSKVPRLITPLVEPQPQPRQHVEVLDNGIIASISRQNSVDANPALGDLSPNMDDLLVDIADGITPNDFSFFDDFTEVPDPNNQQSRQTSHPAQALKQVPQLPHASLTPEQVAAPPKKKNLRDFQSYILSSSLDQNFASIAQQPLAQARLSTQEEAQQIALQRSLLGLPGGLGPRPMPPPPLPAMVNLNTPLRTPSLQTNHPEQTQANPNEFWEFRQPLDPRFAELPIKQQQRLANILPVKINEVVIKWHEQRAAQMNASNIKAGISQMPEQANGQIRQQMTQNQTELEAAGTASLFPDDSKLHPRSPPRPSGIARIERISPHRPKRIFEKRTFEDSSFEGYSEGFVDDGPMARLPHLPQILHQQQVFLAQTSEKAKSKDTPQMSPQQQMKYQQQLQQQRMMAAMQARAQARAVNGIEPHPSPVKTTKKISLRDYKAALMKKTDTSNKLSSGSSPTVAPAVFKPSQANAQNEAEAAHASSGLSVTKYRCLVTECDWIDESWPHLDDFRRHLEIVHAADLRLSEDDLNDFVRRGTYLEGNGLISGEANSEEVPENSTSSVPATNTPTKFTLSEEFIFMFGECSSSDVLQLLKDNWRHYSQWIDGAHMNWQNAAFLESSAQLKNSLGTCLVQSAKGLLPLQGTVLPTIDRQLDEGRHIPAVDISDPQHPEWALLNYFGVIMKGDVQYYLRCLISISEEHQPDVDSVAYIYEQIQAKYRGNEELIRAAFYERDIIFIHSKSQGWMNMKQCISRNITIESDYPTNSYLFRCLISPNGDPIALIVATAALISSSTNLEDISRLFRDVSAALKDVSTSKAAQLLRPLRDKPVFPISNGLTKRGYDKLLDLHNTSWYIADRPLIRESFLGQLPLLALPIEDLSALEDLFRALRLDGRILSKLATSRTQQTGRTNTHWTYTSSLRKKSPFIKALIPQSHPNRMTIMRQIDEIRVSVAADISQTFMLNIAGTEIVGGDVRGQVSLSYTENFLNLLMTEECAAAKCPPYEFATLIADACGIKDPKHFSLLYTTLSNSSLESINTTFKEQGFSIKGLVFDKPKDRYRAQRGDLMRIPSPFWGTLSHVVGSFQGSAEALWFGGFQTGGNKYDPDRDRRLPIMRLSKDNQSSRVVYEDKKTDGWDHIQYLGEHMISKVLRTYLGAYDPERDWTSKLGGRSGHTMFEVSTPCAAFTMRDPKVREQMTIFLIKYGQSQIPIWKENLRANPPVYHLDLAVSAGSKTTSFVITTSQVDRMQKFRMHDNANESNSNVVVLTRVSDVYSENLLSIDLFVDPWRLFNSNNLTFKGTWLARGAIQESTSGPAKKKRKLNGPPVSWATPTISGTHENALTAPRGRRNKDTFAHRALDSGNIRLLYLLPGETGDQMQGVIIHVPFKSPGVYRALSYVWGTDQRTKELVTPDGTLQITLSLSKALQGLRHREKPIMLWVDAICINQKDNTEKAKQIRLLPKIFQNAASTYAFLEGDKGSDAAIQMLMQVRFKAACDENSKLERERAKEELEETLENGLGGETDLGESTKSRKRRSSNHRICSEDWPEDLPRVPASWTHRSIPDLDAAIWSSVEALFRLSWFRRVWIIQEIVGAPHVKIVCGKWIIDWNDLHLAMEIIDREVQMSDDDSSSLKSSWEPFLALASQREWEARHYRWTLMMLLENFRYAESTLSRDRLFALLGLASDGNEAEFEPDYDSPLEDVVLKFARVFVRQGRGLQMLYRAGLSHHSDRFPSWIPDWTLKRASSLYDSSEGGVSFSASGPQQCQIKCIPDTDELLVEGYEVDEIESISKASNVEEDWERYFNEVDTMIDSAILAPVRHLPKDLKWKVPIAGVLRPKVAVSGGLDLKSSYTALRNYLNSKQKEEAKENGNSVNGCLPTTEHTMFIEHMAGDSCEKQAASYIAALQDTVHGWRFVVTKNGYVGVVPNMAKVGDVVAIVKGGRVPFVLRRSGERDGVFRLVGECYVHSLMNGEGLNLPGTKEGEFRLH